MLSTDLRLELGKISRVLLDNYGMIDCSHIFPDQECSRRMIAIFLFINDNTGKDIIPFSLGANSQYVIRIDYHFVAVVSR